MRSAVYNLKSYYKINRSKMNLLKNKLNIILIALIAYIFALIIIESITYDDSIEYFNPKIGTINEITLKLPDKEEANLNIPNRVYGKENFECIVDISDYRDSNNISMAAYANFANLTVYADDKIIYEKNNSTENILGSGTYFMVLFDVPDDTKSNQIKFVYKPLLDSLDYVYLRAIYIGKKSDIIAYKFSKELIQTIIPIILFINFIMVLFLVFLNKNFFKQDHYGILYIAILGLFMGNYFLAQSWIVKYLFVSSNTLIHFLEFTSIQVIPIPLLLFFKYKLDKSFHKLYNIVVSMLFLNFIVQGILILSKRYEYIEINNISTFLIILSMLVILISYIKTDKRDYPIKRKLTLTIIILTPALLIPVISYILTDSIFFEEMSIIATLVFLILEIKEFIFSFSKYQNEVKESEINKKLANTDALTGLQNRLSYNKFVDCFNNSEKIKYAYMISMDLNNLKLINDKYGHLKGDQLISNFAGLLSKEIQKNKNISCFRLGGDEFFAFIEEDKSFDVNAWIENLKNDFIQTKSNNIEVVPSFAAGVYFYDANKDKDRDLEKYFHIADKKMYEDKSMYKNILNTSLETISA